MVLVSIRQTICPLMLNHYTEWCGSPGHRWYFDTGSIFLCQRTMLGEFGHGSSTFGSATVIQINTPCQYSWLQPRPGSGIKIRVLVDSWYLRPTWIQSMLEGGLEVIGPVVWWTSQKKDKTKRLTQKVWSQIDTETDRPLKENWVMVKSKLLGLAVRDWQPGF